MKTMVARYRGRCFVCQGRINKGDLIAWEAKRASHPQCAGSESVAIMFADGSRMWRNRRGRCEDAPCCGCCD